MRRRSQTVIKKSADDLLAGSKTVGWIGLAAHRRRPRRWRRTAANLHAAAGDAENRAIARRARQLHRSADIAAARRGAGLFGAVAERRRGVKQTGRGRSGAKQDDDLCRDPVFQSGCELEACREEIVSTRFVALQRRSRRAWLKPCARGLKPAVPTAGANLSRRGGSTQDLRRFRAPAFSTERCSPGRIR